MADASHMGVRIKKHFTTSIDTEQLVLAECLNIFNVMNYRYPL